MKMKLFALATCGMAMTAAKLTAQTFTTLHSFTATSGANSPNKDGANSYATLILSDNTLYGTAYAGGSSGNGTVFALNTDGTRFTNLHDFTARYGPYYTNWDGDNPQAGVVLSGKTLYGTAFRAGSSDNGTVFGVNTDGTGFNSLYSFTAISNFPNYLSPSATNSDGARPDAVILSGNTLYGTAYFGGTSAYGAIFAVHTNGTGFTNLHSFTATSGSEGGYGINDDGAYAFASVILSSNTLFGTACYGGSSGNGTVFAVKTDGTGFTTLYSFTGASDGATPEAGLILSGNTLYGTAFNGGNGGNGTVYAVNTDGTGFTTLYSFTGTSGTSGTFGNGTNSDGANSDAGLVLVGNTLYGTTLNGGSGGNGTVFAVNTNGTGFTTLHTFTATSGSNSTNSDGANSYATLVSSGNTLYGTTFSGGSGGNGTVFSLSLPAPQLSITSSGTNVLLTWPTNYAGFDFTGYTLQSTTNLLSPAVWTRVFPGPVVVNDQNAVTNAIFATQQFYRLSQ